MGSVPPEGRFSFSAQQMLNQQENTPASEVNFNLTDNEVVLLEQVRALLPKFEHVHTIFIHSLLIYKAVLSKEPITVKTLDEKGEVVEKLIRIKIEDE